MFILCKNGVKPYAITAWNTSQGAGGTANEALIPLFIYLQLARLKNKRPITRVQNITTLILPSIARIQTRIDPTTARYQNDALDHLAMGPAHLFCYFYIFMFFPAVSKPINFCIVLQYSNLFKTVLVSIAKLPFGTFANWYQIYLFNVL